MDFQHLYASRSYNPFTISLKQVTAMATALVSSKISSSHLTTGKTKCEKG